MSFVRALLLGTLLWIDIVRSQHSGSNCQHIEHGACLDYNYNVIYCAPKKDCTFIFSCPEDLRQAYTECYTAADVCLDIANYNYTIHYTNEISPSHSVRYAMYSSEEDGSTEDTSEDSDAGNDKIPYHKSYSGVEHHVIGDDNLSYPENHTASSDGNCSYQMVNFFSAGARLSIFRLRFDTAKHQAILTTLSTVQETYIQCYGRDFDLVRRVNISRVHSLPETREFLQRYILNITQAPMIYFCDVSAPMIYVRKRTQEVVAFGNSTACKYISKIFDVTDDASTFKKFRLELGQKCRAAGFKHCKLMRKQNNTIYYFLQDDDSREFKYVEDFMHETVKNLSTNEDQPPMIEYLRNIEFCFAESTEASGGTILNWGYTLVGTVATPAELCLDDGGMQVTRRCEGDFFQGASWAEPSADCSSTIYIPEITHRLHSFIGEKSITDVFSNLTAETDYYAYFTAVDVNLFSEGLKTMSTVANSRNFKSNFVHGISNIMRVNSTVLKDSQQQLNSTDKILDSFVGFMENAAHEITNFSLTIQPNVLTQVSCPFVSDITGLAIYKKIEGDFTTYDIVNTRFDETFDDLELENLEIAVFVPAEIIYNLTSHLTDEEKAAFKIITTVFSNDGLFNEVESTNRSAGSRILSVDIPGFTHDFDMPIPLLFRPVLNFTNSSCAYWDYGMQKHGEWSTDGGQYLGHFHNQSLIECTFNHITHFALLVLSENIIRIENEDGVVIVINPLDEHDLPLTLITLIGCGMSLLGIIVILMSAILFKDWYKKRLNSIQLSAIIFMEIIVLYVADLDVVVEGSACVAVGAILHYIVLAKFTWMLIIARIQYIKFVKIFENTQIKVRAIIYCLIGWLLPVVPVMLALLIYPDNYEAGLLNFCYPKDLALYIFLIIPICIIILLNLAIFISIMVTVSRSKAQDYGVKMQRVQIRLGIMLFFMLGITWIFGLLGEFLPWSWFMLACLYLFTILGSLQGFMLFVFTILLDKSTMELWGNLFKFTPKSKKPYERSTRSEVIYTSDSENATVSFFRKRD